MGQLQRPDEQIDADLDRIVRTSGRAPITAAGVTVGGAAAVVAIDRLYNGAPTQLAYLAAAMILTVTAPWLLALGLSLRRRSEQWATEEQRRRSESHREQLEVRGELAALRTELAALRRLRGAARTTTGRQPEVSEGDDR